VVRVPCSFESGSDDYEAVQVIATLLKITVYQLWGKYGCLAEPAIDLTREVFARTPIVVKENEHEEPKPFCNNGQQLPWKSSDLISLVSMIQRSRFLFS
jgi:hypothetical protein